jgi:hypothetical protein
MRGPNAEDDNALTREVKANRLSSCLFIKHWD